MKTWSEAWDDALPEQKKEVIRWSKGVERNALIGRNQLNQCRGCYEFFAGVDSFDAHRVGAWGKRRCLSLTEMSKKGLRRNEYFYWTANGKEIAGEDAV